MKRQNKDGEKLLKAHPAAPNRFEVTGLLFRAQQQLFGWDDSSRNRQAVLEIARELVKAPNEYAELRLDADFLLIQSGSALQKADAKGRLSALMPMAARYRDTSAESLFFQVLPEYESGSR